MRFPDKDDIEGWGGDIRSECWGGTRSNKEGI